MSLDRSSPMAGAPAPEGDAHPVGDAPDRPSEPEEGDAPFRWRTNLLLFLATVVSVLLIGAGYEAPEAALEDLLRAPHHGWRFAVPLLSILLVHEFGHYFAARAHGVRTSLPYFIPLPFIGLGTLGAVISMSGRVKSRNALLDFGAAGPLAGLVVAIPVLVIGLLESEIRPITGPGLREGQSLLYIGLKRLILGPIPEGHDVFLSPVAYAGWAGLLVTMINLLPVAQLDGGHVAYALLGSRQNRISRLVHQGVLVLFAVNLARFVPPALREGTWDALKQALNNSIFWLVWYGILHAVRWVGGPDHPPTEPGELTPLRKVIAVFTLALYVLLLMPTPMAME